MEPNSAQTSLHTLRVSWELQVLRIPLNGQDVPEYLPIPTVRC